MLLMRSVRPYGVVYLSFNRHPPLGVNATLLLVYATIDDYMFQWAPTLGGECYALRDIHRNLYDAMFQWAPTLGGECYAIFSVCAYL